MKCSAEQNVTERRWWRQMALSCGGVCVRLRLAGRSAASHWPFRETDATPPSLVRKTLWRGCTGGPLMLLQGWRALRSRLRKQKRQSGVCGLGPGLWTWRPVSGSTQDALGTGGPVRPGFPMSHSPFGPPKKQTECWTKVFLCWGKIYGFHVQTHSAHLSLKHRIRAGNEEQGCQRLTFSLFSDLFVHFFVFRADLHFNVSVTFHTHILRDVTAALISLFVQSETTAGLCLSLRVTSGSDQSRQFVSHLQYSYCWIF